jgi:hypothetical protein
VGNITKTPIDLGSAALEVWGTLDGVLRNASGIDQSYVEGTLLSRNPANGELIPYAPAAVADKVVDVTVDVGSLSANTATDTAVVVAGALVGDLVEVEPLGTWNAGLTQPQGRVLVDGTVQVRIANVTGGAIDPASQTFRISLRHNGNILKPHYMLTYPVDVTNAAGTAPVTVLSAGKVNQNRCKVHGSPPTTATANDLHLLLERPIIPVDVVQQSG